MFLSSNISLKRPVTSYAKVQHFVGNLIRNRKYQVNRKRISALRYLNVGCGRNAHPTFINMDYLWHPQIDICWDITRGLPFEDQSIEGIFTEHCLEHFSLPVAFEILKDLRRVLKPGGTLRIVVPDAEIYLRTYLAQLGGDKNAKFPFQDQEVFNGVTSPVLSVNRVFYQDRDSSSGHQFIYDFNLMEKLLKKVGFSSVNRSDFREGNNSILLIDDIGRREESLYVEAFVGNGHHKTEIDNS